MAKRIKNLRGMYKLTTSQVMEIVNRYQEGERGKVLADEFGITEKTVLRYIRNNGRKSDPHNREYSGPSKSRRHPVNFANTYFNKKRDIQWTEDDYK